MKILFFFVCVRKVEIINLNFCQFRNLSLKLSFQGDRSFYAIFFDKKNF